MKCEPTEAVEVGNEGGTSKSEAVDSHDHNTKPKKKGNVRKTRVSNNVRTEHRARLRRILDKLIRNHRWKEACGVLSVLLQATGKERCPIKNREKYSMALELLNKMGSNSVTPSKIFPIYELWKKKNKGASKDVDSVQLEHVLFCITHGNVDVAYQAAERLIQERDYSNDPHLNLMVGLAFYNHWYSSIPEETQLKNYSTYDAPNLSNISEMVISSDAVYIESQAQCSSDSSVCIGKEAVCKEWNTDEVNQHKDFNIQESAQLNENEEAHNLNYGQIFRSASIFHSRGLNVALLPMQLPDSDEIFEKYTKSFEQNKDGYNKALKHLKLALGSSPPILGALLPLMQLLLLGNQVAEAMEEIEKLCNSLNGNIILPLRLKASLLECFNSKEPEKISICYEEILKKDPTCSHSLARLITMHRNGGYRLKPLIEMIALYLDSTSAISEIWEVLASCFLKLAQYEGDRMSVCGIGRSVYDFESISTFNGSIVDERSRKLWRLRYKWWSRCHFSESTRISETEAGNVQLLSFKAACALHLYGPTFDYASSICAYLEKENNNEMISFLDHHRVNSVQLFGNLNKENE